MRTPEYQSELARRRKLLAPNLSLSYQNPLKIIRGEGQYLYDDKGNQYLDCVNNVSHVGHCHPVVTGAIIEQAQQLNTNTRYLHDRILDFSERLLQHCPDHLDTCFFVNSGSEANDLALRLAQTYTGNRGVICQQAAYHGNLTSLIDISPYKHLGRGGKGTPDYVRVVPLADSFRGQFAGEPQQGERYAAQVSKACNELSDSEFGLSAFIAEAMPGCGGQIVPPDDYLQKAFTYVKQKGGLCIADEVQTGLGRSGEQFWAFECFSAVPDIITIGKPLGNGHPVAAVVTRREIADAFNNGMEYFNTFGGNPVSSAAGEAVLRVIEDEALQQRAASLGKQLQTELLSLMKQEARLSDVRGKGLFIGLEVCEADNPRKPDALLAKRIVEDMRDKQILLSTDGPDNNVIKFKPPMVLNSSDISRIAEELGRSFKLCN